MKIAWIILKGGNNLKKGFVFGIAFSAIILLAFIVFFITFLLTPYKGYEGEKKALYTEAIFSLLGNRGYYSNGEQFYDPEIIIIEEDDYGRIMFSYVENNDISSYNYLIAQKLDDHYVYFYPDYNFISSEYDAQIDSEQAVFTPDEIYDLKTVNDWNLPLDESKMIHFEITDLKEMPKSIVSNDIFETLLNALAQKSNYLGDDTLYRYSEYFLTDDYGRTMYYVYGVGRDALGEGVSPDSVAQYFYTVIIIQPDGSYDLDNSIMELSSFQEYQNELYTFKTLNEWNQPSN